jgi:hypothetical protein
MPVDPSTIVGNMYYLCDSPIVEDFEGASRMNGKELKRHLRGIGRDYRFGEMVGVSEVSRIGIYRHRTGNLSCGIQKSASVSVPLATHILGPSRSQTTRTI